MTLAAMPDYETDFATLLEATSGSLTGNVTPGPMRPAPTVGMLHAFVKASGGLSLPHNDGVTHWLTVQVMLRTARNEYATGEALCRVMHTGMNMRARTVVGANEYIDIKAMTAGFVHVEQDVDDAHVFVAEFEMVYEQPFT